MPDWISVHEESIESSEELEPPSQSCFSASNACLFIRYPRICLTACHCSSPVNTLSISAPV